MERRRFLQMAAAGTLVFGLPDGTAEAARLRIMARPGLLGLFGDSRTVRAVGAAYRCAHPDENGPARLVAALTSEAGLSRDLAGNALRTRLERQVRADFARGRTVQVNGWILSVTEARQCALFSLLYG